MKFSKIIFDYARQQGGIWILIIVLTSGLYVALKDTDVEAKMREIKGYFTGRLAKPSEPDFFQPAIDMISPEPDFQLKKISHIPAITYDQKMPHPYVGVCKYCHLFKGGAPAGSLPKTPVGALLEEASRDINKLGPTLLPTSKRPHPAAGRCIKCHDFYVKVPLEQTKNTNMRWKL